MEMLLWMHAAFAKAIAAAAPTVLVWSTEMPWKTRAVFVVATAVPAQTVLVWLTVMP
jgi:hypothetical protein